MSFNLKPATPVRVQRGLGIVFALSLALPGMPHASELGPETGAGPGLRLEIVRGRARLRAAEGMESLPAGTFVRGLRGESELELAPGGLAEIFWPGISSMRVQGSALVAWNDPWSGTGSGHLELELGEFRELDLEVRDGPIRALLPFAWRAELDRGAFQFRRLSDGSSAMLQLAGLPVTLERHADPLRVRPPIELAIGRWQRLGAGDVLDSIQDRSAGAPAWDTADWPWGAPRLGGGGAPATGAIAIDGPELAGPAAGAPERSTGNPGMTRVEAREPATKPAGEPEQLLEAPLEPAGGGLPLETSPELPPMPEALVEPLVELQEPTSEPEIMIEPIEPPKAALQSTPEPVDTVEPAPQSVPARESVVEPEVPLETLPVPEPEPAEEPLPTAGEGVAPIGQEEPTSAPEPEAPRPEPVVPYTATAWRNVERAHLLGRGVIVVEQRGEEIELVVRRLAGDTVSFELRLPPGAAAVGRRCFLPGRDLLLMPRTRVVLDSEGRMLSYFGRLKVEPRLEGRGRFEGLRREPWPAARSSE